MEETIYEVKLDMCKCCGEYKNPFQHYECFDKEEYNEEKYEQVDGDLVVAPNNCFCRELCVFGHLFSADEKFIYGLKQNLDDWGYVCYDCAEQLRKNCEERNAKA